MKHFLTMLTLVVFYTQSTFSQTIESRRKAAETLWTDYDQNTQNPSQLPAKIPLNVTNSNIDKENIPATYSALKAAMEKLAKNSGGIISFTNTSPATIKFSNTNREIDIVGTPFDGPYKTIVIQGNNKITFDGSNQSSIFVARRKLRIVIQDAIFQNAFLSRQVIQANNFRFAGGAIEMLSGAYIRVHGCTFRNNSIAEWNDTPGGSYDGVGENQNGAAIRLHTGTTAEIFDTDFINNKAVTGGAIGGTSINKITIMDCLFDKSFSTSYNTKNSTNRRIVEGAGALRIDRSKKPVEIYRTTFSNNEANIKASVMEVFIRPIGTNGNEAGGEYPGPNGYALIIDNCTFRNNKYYNFKGASDPERGDFYGGSIMFHGGSLNANFKGATMKISNSSFIGNEVGQSNITSFLSYEIDNTIFANTKSLRLKDKQGKYRTGKGALMLRGDAEVKSIKIDRCTFYNNEPNTGDSTQFVASDIFFWGNGSNATLNNSIFYRQNTNASYKQVIKPLKGNGNNQFVPQANMSQFSEVATSTSNKTNPNIVVNNIVDMCLGQNSLPKDIGGLPDCSGSNSGGNNNSDGNTGSGNTPPAGTAIIIHDGDTGYTESGTWLNSGLNGAKDKSRYSSTVGAYAQWTPNFASAGQYKVEIYKVAWTGSDANANITIKHTGGTASKSVNYTTTPSAWVDLGTYSFASGTTGYVRNTRSGGTARADAVRFTPVSEGNTSGNNNGGNTGGDSTGGNTTGTVCDGNATITGLSVARSSNGTSATLTFNELSGSDNYEVRTFVKGNYSGSGIAGTGALWSTGKSSPITINGLTATTVYTVVLRSTCLNTTQNSKVSTIEIPVANANGGNTSGGNAFFIINRQTGKKIAPSDSTNGASIIQVDATQNGNIAKWEEVATSGGYFYLKNVSTGQYFRPATDADASGLVQRPTSYSGNYTQWKKVTSSSGYFYLENRQTKKYIRPQGDGNNSPLEQRPTTWTGNYTQWKFESTSAKTIVSEISLNIEVTSNPVVNGSINLVNANGTSFSINTLSGAEIKVGTVTDNSVNVSNLSSGLYIIVFTKDGKRQIEKVIIE